jgi:PAS domain S-box-containing protein
MKRIMKGRFRFVDWPLRSKFAALLVVASLLPVTVATLISIRDARTQLLRQTELLLSARGDQLAGTLDNFNENYQRTAERITHLPASLLPQNGAADPGPLESLLKVLPSNDSNVLAVAVLDEQGTVRAASDARLRAVTLGDRAYLQQARAAAAGSAISDVRLAEPQLDGVPAIVIAAVIRGAGRPVSGYVVLWIRASGLWQLMNASNGLAGQNSFATLLDSQGIRIAHTSRDDYVFHPVAALPAPVVDSLTAQQRFGPRTRQLLTEVRAFPDLYMRAATQVPERSLFRGRAADGKEWNYAVARRLRTAPWTVFYVVPEEVVLAQIAHMTRDVLILAAVILLLALAAGTLFSAGILEPVQALSAATSALAQGNLSARVVTAPRGDELGALGVSFNRMAERIESQAQQLQLAHQELESRVEERTAELAREVAERTRAQELSRASQQLLEGIVNSTEDAVISKTLQGIITSWNRGAQRLFGYAAHEAIGRSMLMLIPPERVQEEPAILARIARGESVDHFETVRVRSDGTRIDISATISPIRDGDGQVIGASKIARDITERMVQERRQREQLERLNLLQQMTRAIGERQDLTSIFQVVIATLEDQMPVGFGGICLFEAGTPVVTVSELGARAAALASSLNLSPGTQLEIEGNGLARCVAGQLVYEPDISLVQYDLPRRLAAGNFRSLVIVPLAIESQVFGVLVAARRETHAFSSAECEFLRQVAEHAALAAKQTELYGALQRAYEDLRQTQQAVMQQERLRALGQMASGIAHDINNSIAPMMLYTEYLLDKEPNLSERARGYLKTIEQAVSDVAETVARMREFYRNREAQQALAPLQLNVLVQQVVALTRARWSDIALRKGAVIEVATQLATDLPEIMGVESELRDALTNLVLNAVDALPDGGSLTLRTRVDEASPRVCVEVVDTGLGMDEQTRERCLEPFFTTKGQQGTGLGLAMVYGAMQRHDGNVEIDSAPGRGTTMRLRFPLPRATAEPSMAPAAVALSAPRRLKLLLIDDDALVLNSLRDTLEAEGHSVSIASGGQAGVDAFFAARDAGEPFSTVITDLGMPYFDGRRVAATLKASCPETPVIMLTGWGQRLAIEGDLPAHVDILLSKPPRLSQLREALGRCMASTAAAPATALGSPGATAA